MFRAFTRTSLAASPQQRRGSVGHTGEELEPKAKSWKMFSLAVASSSSSLLPNAPSPLQQPTMSADSPFTPHWRLAPRQYVARRLATDSSPLTIDGDLEKPEWAEVEWSAPFGDIRGVADAPKEAQPTAKQQTRMKMRWDDEYLYVAAHLESDFPVHASFTKHNEPIFTEDSDFEVFVDPGGTTHAYKELEINALNTVWNLMLNRCSPTSVGVRVRAGAGERCRDGRRASPVPLAPPRSARLPRLPLPSAPSALPAPPRQAVR